MSTTQKPLTPPDRERCQAEKPNGNTFMTLGGRPGRVRCSNKPAVIATERHADACEAEAGTDPDLTAAKRDPLREIAVQQTKRKRRRTA